MKQCLYLCHPYTGQVSPTTSSPVDHFKVIGEVPEYRARAPSSAPSYQLLPPCLLTNLFILIAPLHPSVLQCEAVRAINLAKDLKMVQWRRIFNFDAK